MAKRLKHARDLVANLGPVEREFLRGLVAGGSHAAIASKLGLKETDAASVRQSLMEKLEAQCTADAVRDGIYFGL